MSIAPYASNIASCCFFILLILHLNFFFSLSCLAPIPATVVDPSPRRHDVDSYSLKHLGPLVSQDQGTAIR